MKKVYMIFIALVLLLAGCNTAKQSQDVNPRPKQLSYWNAHPETVPMKSRGRVLPDKRGENNLPTNAAKPHIESIGFLEPVNPAQAVSDVNEAARNLTYIGFFSYRVQPNGDLIPLNDASPLAATKRNHAAPMLVITNFASGNFQPDIAHRIFTDPMASRRLIHNVIRVMKQKGYRALNVDFEHIREKDRQLYNGFLATLLPQVKKEGFLVSTALAPKSSDNQAGPWHGAHDYAFHGKIADFVILMTYEWGWTGGPPMAVSPIPQVRKVVNYAVSKIPREKIIMGAPLYGYDWILPYKKGGPPAKRVSPQEAETFAYMKSLKIQYNNRDQAPYFFYTDQRGKKHVVWFENTQSAQAKFNLIKEYRLRGIGYWLLGEDFPRNWSLLRDNFNIRKY
ncbi:glycosyl hydrolase family 18 protein [Polycladomyces subterraneus]|uniref:Glycosyl hydrolase family 18 protein n=1 Tax=Polycladomyces subterraneus TaxID=1016997 RepID=A0ABT8IKF4_9BACL|nr:glycosyl hydrolase family 18 protein [Polycladomyces subterraneus]MDN4593239.1 glycosyl hydrolase family 18 protein [Polycladomyces subterraneus]